MPSEPKMCTCGMMMAGGEPCAAHFPVSVPEERQEKLPQTEEEWRTYVMMQGEVIKGRYGLGEYAQQPRESVLKSALDALAVAVKPLQDDVAWLDAEWKNEGREPLLFYNVHRDGMHELLSAITALLDGRTTT